MIVKYKYRTIRHTGNIICKIAGFKSLVDRLFINRGDVLMFQKEHNDEFYIYNEGDYHEFVCGNEVQDDSCDYDGDDDDDTDTSDDFDMSSN